MACSTISFGPRFHPRSAPVTFWFIVLSALLNVVTFFGGDAVTPLLAQFVFEPSHALARPWTLLLYPFANLCEPWWFLLLGYVFWWVGTDLERWWGPRVQFGFCLSVAVLTGLCLSLGAVLHATPQLPVVMGVGPVLCGLFTVWGLRWPDRQIILLIVPVSGRVLMIVEIAATWWMFGPYYGLFAVLGAAGSAALYFFYGQHLHAFFRRLGGSPEKRAKRERDRKFKRIMKQANLHLVDEDDRRVERPN